MPFSGIKTCEEEANAGEKKRRLTQEQVRSLENHFELGKKLEPERKLALATTLGLQPKQVAIWFQNRRARWKAKELEKDYDVLKSKFQEIKSEHEFLKSQNKKLQAKILALKGQQELLNLNKDTEACFSNRSENSSEKNNLDWSSANPSIWLSDMDHLLQSSSRSSEIHGNSEGGGSFSQLLCSMEDQPSVFTWLDRNSFH